MQKQNGVGIGGAFVEVVHTQLAAIGVVDLKVVGGKVLVRQVVEAFIGCSEGFHFRALVD